MADKKKKLTSWEFVNSSFGLWLLSTVAIGLITFGYSSFSNFLKNENERVNKIIKLDQEIEGRFYQLLVRQERKTDSLLIQEGLRDFTKDHQESFKELWFQFKNSPSDSYYGLHSMYPEYDKRNTVSLIIELSSLLKDVNEKLSLKKVSQIITANQGIPIKISSKDQLEKTLDFISSELRIIRWKKYWPEVEPFDSD